MAVRDSAKMRITPCKLWKAIVCLLIILWFCFSIFHVFHLRRGEINQLEAFEPGSSACSDNQSTTTISSNPFTTSRVPDIDSEQQQLQWRLMRNQLSEWHSQAASHCSTGVTTLGVAGFARLRRVLLDPSLASGKLGGENIFEVLNQPESSEYWDLKQGVFSVLCPNASRGSGFGPSTGGNALTRVIGPNAILKSHKTLHQYLSATVTIADREEFAKLRDAAESLPGPVLAVTRHEYANLYHSIALVYNAFANSVFYGFNPAEATVLLIDGHPRGTLDPLWHALFRRVVRIGQLTRRQTLDDLIWVAEGHMSPVLADRPSLPLIEQFRRFVLSQHSIAPEPPKVPSARNCTGSRVIIILRRDYVAHPRNPQGRVVRQIANEADVMIAVRRALPHLKLNVTSVAMETLTFREQLSLISDTRVLIGMHGAGLTHAMFLPKWSGVVELFPDFWTQENYHFRNIATWRGLAYEQWTSGSGSGDIPITIPSDVIPNLMRNVLGRLGCNVASS